MLGIFNKKNNKLKCRKEINKSTCISLLKEAEINPVLADIGSAGISNKIWENIAMESIILGFDPDSRNPDPKFGNGYKKSIMINKAIISDDNATSVDFILTQYPSCSSMLEPDLDSLSSFSFRDYFQIINQETVAATSLNRVIESENLNGINWIKIDSQGCDMRILKSLNTENFSKLLAVDIEPGLIKAYKGEDLFTDCHSWLIDQGFWMSKLEYQAYPKIRPETLEKISKHKGINTELILQYLPKTPTAIEGHYLREIEWLCNNHCDPAVYILACIFGLLDGQYIYSYDVASAFIEHNSDNIILRKIQEISIEYIN